MANKPAVPAEATPGHNSKELTEAERKALFFHHLRKRMGHIADAKEIAAAKKADGKLAQADGLVLGDVDYAIKALGADDKATVTDRFVSHGEILSWLGLTPGFQSDMFRDRAPVIERIEKDGELAGLAALERVSSYEASSEEDITWLRGYDNGQAIVRDNFQSAMEKRNAAKGSAADQLIEGEAHAGDDPFADNDDEASRVAAE